MMSPSAKISDHLVLHNALNATAEGCAVQKTFARYSVYQ